MFGNLSLYKFVLLNWTTHFHDWNVFVPLMQQSMRKEDENKGCSDPCKKRFYQHSLLACSSLKASMLVL